MTVRQPLVEAMLRYKEQQVYPLHTPGHKGGRGMAEPLKTELGAAALQLDVSLMAELDDIHQPEGCLKEAQDLAAQLYGSDACFFCVNGTTEAIQAMLMTALNPGDKILIPRNAHRSVFSGLVLAGAEPIYVTPQYLPEFNLEGQVTAEQIEQTFTQYPDLKAVFLTSPNYYGLAADVKTIAKIAHAHGAVLLVDEAHGPHLGFNTALPPSALQSGADACAQSTHKITGAMTQCSMLQVKQEHLDLQRAKDTMSLLTTTSPNYLLMASLDAARAQLEEQGFQMMEHALQATQVLRTAILKVPGLKLLDEQVIGQAGIDAVDLTKVVVNFRDLGMTGIDAAACLRKQKFAVELADAENILFLVTYADWQQEWPQVVRGIVQALQKMPQGKSRTHTSVKLPHADAVATEVSPREAFYGEKETVSLAAAAGRICAESIAFYPPGIPVILPGEIFTETIIQYCQEMLPYHLVIHGAADKSLATVRVLKDRHRGVKS